MLETLQEINSVSGSIGEYFSSSNLLYAGKSTLPCPYDNGAGTSAIIEVLYAAVYSHRDWRILGAYPFRTQAVHSTPGE